MRRFTSLLLAVLSVFSCSGIDRTASVTQEEMAEIYTQLQTPVKHGIIIHPSDTTLLTDSPGVYRHEGKWYMTYVGFDGKGYETYLAQSNNLMNWTILGKILTYRDGAFDQYQRAGYPALQDMRWGGSYQLQKYDGKYWMTYIAGDQAGYEAGALSVGLANSDNPALACEWNALDRPIISPFDEDAQWFERTTQFKSHIIMDCDRVSGHRFLLYYNAKGMNPADSLTEERIGLAFSEDMKHWARYENNPVLMHEGVGITGDPQIQKMGDIYVMFYFKAFDPAKPYQAYNTFACSRDLIHWYDWEGEDLIYPSEDYDCLFAHKSWVVSWEGVTYHFYCACDDKGHRGIAVATSK